MPSALPPMQSVGVSTADTSARLRVRGDRRDAVGAQTQRQPAWGP